MLKRTIVVEVLAAGLSVVYATEMVELNAGKDWYYDLVHDSIHHVVHEPVSKSYIGVPYAHAPEVPEGYPSRAEYVLRGKAFKPQEFWSQNTDKQLLFIADAIFECDLLTVVSRHRSSGLKRYLMRPTGKPYSPELELQFEKAVWERLHTKYDISFESFTASLRSMLIPEDKLYSAPLIVYFADKLAPEYEFHYKGTYEWNRVLMKVIKHPSKFEVLTGTPDVGIVVYEKKQQNHHINP